MSTRKFISSSILLVSLGLATAQSLTVVNKCPAPVFLFTQTSVGSILNNVLVPAGGTQNMRISSNWNGAINTGTGCSAAGSSCTTGGQPWDGRTPFSRAEFNFNIAGGLVNYDLSAIYGWNVGMEITTQGCANPACDLGSSGSGCPVPGPQMANKGPLSCFSSCCSSTGACAGGALPANGGGCPGNANAGPNSRWYNGICPNVYAYPTNDAHGLVDFTCGKNIVTLTLCPGVTSHY